MTQLRFPLMLAALSLFAACGDSSDDTPPASAPNAVEVAQSTPDLSILTEAVKAAGLDGTLSGPGPFTIFAPTNDAFAALLAELGTTKDALLADKPLLTAVLKYHVVSGTVRKADIPLGHAVTPLAGGYFKIDAAGAGAVITDGRNRTANVVTPDVATSNGVVHVIDKVLLPADKTVVQTAAGISDFSILVEAVTAAGLGDTLSGPGPFTVFAPTNEAFAALLAELGVTKEALLADKALLTKVLTYHVIPGRVLKADVVPGVQPATVEGETFSIGGDLKIADGRGRTASITATDVLASNGVIHVIDKVILPAP